MKKLSKSTPFSADTLKEAAAGIIKLGLKSIIDRNQEIPIYKKLDMITEKIGYREINLKYVLQDKLFLKCLEKYLKAEMNIKLEDIAYEILMDENPINSLYELIFLI